MWLEPHNGKFRIRERRGGKCITIQSGIDTKTAAKRLILQYSGDQLRGDFVDPRAGRLTVAEFVDAWWGTWGEGGHVNTLKISAAPRRLNAVAAQPMNTNALSANDKTRTGVPSPMLPERRPLSPLS